MLVRQSVAGYISTCAAIRDADFREIAKTISVPTLCLAGDGDETTPPQFVEALSQSIPKSLFEVIRGAGHIPCIEQPEALSALIRDFVRTILVGES